jgi:hypothetical protein
MNELLNDFYSGYLSSFDCLQSEYDSWNRIVEEYENDNVYSGDSYYQDSLGIRSALLEAIEQYEDFYDIDGVFINNK